MRQQSVERTLARYEEYTQIQKPSHMKAWAQGLAMGLLLAAGSPFILAGAVLCLTFVGIPLGLPLIMLGIWPFRLMYKNWLVQDTKMMLQQRYAGRE